MSWKAACCLLLCAAYHLLFNLRNTCVGSSVFFKRTGTAKSGIYNGSWGTDTVFELDAPSVVICRPSDVYLAQIKQFRFLLI